MTPDMEIALADYRAAVAQAEISAMDALLREILAQCTMPAGLRHTVEEVLAHHGRGVVIGESLRGRFLRAIPRQ